MEGDRVEIRPAGEHDRVALALLFAAVAEERDGIAAEPPIDVEARTKSWQLDATLVAIAVDEVVGSLFVVRSGFGFGEIGMMVARDWRSRGVGSALVAGLGGGQRAHEGGPVGRPAVRRKHVLDRQCE